MIESSLKSPELARLFLVQKILREASAQNISFSDREKLIIRQFEHEAIDAEAAPEEFKEPSEEIAFEGKVHRLLKAAYDRDCQTIDSAARFEAERYSEAIVLLREEYLGIIASDALEPDVQRGSVRDATRLLITATTIVVVLFVIILLILLVKDKLL